MGSWVEKRLNFNSLRSKLEVKFILIPSAPPNKSLRELINPILLRLKILLPSQIYIFTLKHIWVIFRNIIRDKKFLMKRILGYLTLDNVIKLKKSLNFVHGHFNIPSMRMPWIIRGLLFTNILHSTERWSFLGCPSLPNHRKGEVSGRLLDKVIYLIYLRKISRGWKILQGNMGIWSCFRFP